MNNITDADNIEPVAWLKIIFSLTDKEPVTIIEPVTDTEPVIICLSAVESPNVFEPDE